MEQGGAGRDEEEEEKVNRHVLDATRMSSPGPVAPCCSHKRDELERQHAGSPSIMGLLPEGGYNDSINHEGER
jgi:hypothetical protein